MARCLPALWLAAAALLPCARAHAHGQRLARVELVEESAASAALSKELSLPEPSLGFEVDGCSVAELGAQPEALERRFTIRCSASDEGRTLHMRGLGPIVERAVVHAKRASGAEITALLSPDAPTLRLSEPGSAARLFSRYFRLGLEHIASGADHLIFLALLVLALRRLRPVLLAESAFTVSHTLSYAATALGWVQIPSGPTEVCIALSLFLLALDVKLERPMSASQGALTAFVFGFVHGLGFAGGLQGIGVDAHAAGFAVLSFGAGVEAAQVAAVLLGWLLCASMVRSRAWPRVADGLVLSGGAASAYWLLERGVSMLSP